MKKTGKIVIGVTALVMAFSLSSLTACGSTPKGTIEGNYKQATSEELDAALEGVKSDNITGDPTADGYRFGIEFSSEINVSADVAAEGNLSAGFQADYKTLTTETGVTGAGSMSLNYNMTQAQQESVAADYSVQAYNDGENIYCSLNLGKQEGSDAEQKLNVKLNYEVIVGYVTSLIPSSPAAFAADAATPDVGTAEELAELGITAYLDTANGLKLKLSASEDTVWLALAEEEGYTPDMIAQLQTAVTFNTFKYDMYFALDSSDVFSAASVVFDIDVTVDQSKIAAPAAVDSTSVQQTTNFKIDGYVMLSAYNGEAPALPEGIATDLSYLDVTDRVKETIDEVIGGVISGTYQPVY